MIKEEFLKKGIDEIVKKANFILRRDVLTLIKRAYLSEKNNKAKLALAWILENSRIAQKENLAICQDTGLPLCFIELGRGVEISLPLISVIKSSLEEAYKKNYLRASLVDPWRRDKPAYKGVPVYIEPNPRIRGLKITLFPKGFGSENKSRLKMFNPTATLKEMEDFIIKVVKEAGPEACPPFIVGVGVGGSSDSCLLLAKKALMDRVDKPNKDRFLASWEERLLKRINSLKIGPMGLGGSTTALAVKIKISPTHIAGLPLGVNVSCWALRSASLLIG